MNSAGRLGAFRTPKHIPGYDGKTYDADTGYEDL